MKLNGEYINDDWRNVLKHFPDNHFSISIVDPPYFNGPEKRGYYGSDIGAIKVKRQHYPILNWENEIPNNDFYEEVCRVSHHQIIWGINYFEFAGRTHGRIIWDKCNGSSSFSDCEIASCSFHESTRMFRFMWNGMMQGKSVKEGHIMQGNKKLNEKKINPTQKPVALYKWMILKYIFGNKQMQSFDKIKILDTHVGSASSLIAYEDADIEYFGIEKHKKMYNLSLERLQNHVSFNKGMLFKNI